MNENLNLVEILKNVPQGTKLYSPIFGEVGFDGISKEETRYPIKVDTGLEINEFAADGRFAWLYQGEVMLFPSKEQRDWSKFKVGQPKVKATLYPFDRVLARDFNTGSVWRADLFSHYDESNENYPCVCVASSWTQVIPYNEQTAHLLCSTDDCPIDYELTYSKEYRPM